MKDLKCLRAKIDMASPNLNMRDPVIYRIKKAHHHRTGDDWCIYPMYDFAHGQSDSIEEITHSLCTLEFENHRPLYNWFIENLEIFPSRQIEFARLNLDYTITSKRKLRQLVTENYVSGWDDPRMPTVTGMRRRGYTPTSLRNFAEKAGIAKRENVIEMGLLEYCVREDLNKVADRIMVVHDPVKLIITNYPEGNTEMMTSVKNPEDEGSGTFEIPFSREIFIERADFMEDPPKKFFRLGPGRNVRLKSAYIIQCQDYKKHPETGEIEEIYCSYYENSKSGQDESGIKAKGTLHWVSVNNAVPIELRLYDRLFKDPNPNGHKEKHFLEFFNHDSLTISHKALGDPTIYEAKPGMHYQFLRKGYYTMDSDSTKNRLIFNRTVTMRDAWAKRK